MHVLLVPSWYPTSASDVSGSFFREQALALARAGCMVGIIAPRHGSLRDWRSIRAAASAIDFMDDHGVVTLRAHATNWFPKLPGLQCVLWSRLGRRLFAEYVKRMGKPDVIHAHGLLFGGCLARELSRTERIPYVVTEHSSAFARHLVSPAAIGIATAAAESASHCFAVSMPFCRLLADELSMKDEAWTYLPNMVDQRFLTTPLGSSSDASRFAFLHVSLLDQNKAVDVLLRAFACAFRENPDVLLRIGGDSERRASLESLAASLGIAGQVTFLGKLTREAVLMEMQTCDAFVLPSRYETFGVVLIEALALGKPVIATRCGGPESIVTAANGMLVPIDDPVRLAEGMQHVKNHRGEYDPVAIRCDCSSRFSSDVITRKLIDRYRVVVEANVTNVKGAM